MDQIHLRNLSSRRGRPELRGLFVVQGILWFCHFEEESFELLNLGYNHRTS